MNINSLLPNANSTSNANAVSIQLENKWERTGLLEGMSNEVERKGMAVLLENQAKQLVTEASSTGTSKMVQTKVQMVLIMGRLEMIS